MPGNAHPRLHITPLLKSLVTSVEEEERVIETIISCVESEDTNGILRAANELVRIRRHPGTPNSQGHAH